MLSDDRLSGVVLTKAAREAIYDRMERLEARTRGKATSFQLEPLTQDRYELIRDIDGEYDTHRIFSHDQLNEFIGH